MKCIKYLSFCAIFFTTSIMAAEVAQRPKILITSNSVPPKGLEILSEKCYLIRVQNDTDIKELLEKAKGVDGIFVATFTTRFGKELIDAAGANLKIVATMSAGYDHIDVDEFKKRGIKLAHTPEVLSNAVANVAILLALAASRRMQEGRNKIETGTWITGNSTWLLGKDIEGSSVGIVGLGSIGQAIAKRFKAFDVKEILYTGHKEKPQGKELGAKFVSLDDLLKDSDFVIMAVPLTKQTENMCNEEFFKKMKKSAVFVNISRGKVVDQKALVQALKNGDIFAAGLDVMTPEPLPKDDELIKLPNCVLMPHLGSATEDTRNEMSALAAKNVLLGVAGEPLLTPIY